MSSLFFILSFYSFECIPLYFHLHLILNIQPFMCLSSLPLQYTYFSFSVSFLLFTSFCIYIFMSFIGFGIFLSSIVTSPPFSLISLYKIPIRHVIIFLILLCMLAHIYKYMLFINIFIFLHYVWVT